MTLSPELVNGDHRILLAIICLEAPAIRRQAEDEGDIAYALALLLFVT